MLWQVLGFFTYDVIFRLHLDQIYTAPYFLGLMALLGASLAACTSTRYVIWGAEHRMCAGSTLMTARLYAWWCACNGAYREIEILKLGPQLLPNGHVIL